MQIEWTPEEDAVLEAVANAMVKLDEMEKRLPGRTRKAIKRRLHFVRKRMGIQRQTQVRRTPYPVERTKNHVPMLDPSDPGVDDDDDHAWRRRAEESNRRFIEALQAAA